MWRSCPGQLVRYNFTGIANNSTTALESFYWRDTLPVKAVRLQTIYTGTWNTPGNYKIVYRTNLSRDTWRTLADNLSTSKNYVLDASPAALGLASNEYVTEFMAAFGIVPPTSGRWRPLAWTARHLPSSPEVRSSLIRRTRAASTTGSGSWRPPAGSPASMLPASPCLAPVIKS